MARGACAANQTAINHSARSDDLYEIGICTSCIHNKKSGKWKPMSIINQRIYDRTIDTFAVTPLWEKGQPQATKLIGNEGVALLARAATKLGGPRSSDWHRRFFQDVLAQEYTRHRVMTLFAAGPPAEALSIWKRAAPGLVLMILAPIVAEVLPGATRLSSIFVLPVEICVWGGGAILIRDAVRRWQLGWRNMLFLALALAVAEECLIQQTSLAPMVIRLKGEVYARAYGVNYVYLLWALMYESVFVVFVPILLAEMVFPDRRDGLWLSRVGLVFVVGFLALGCFLAWFTWTQIARPKVFKVPAYNPPWAAVWVAVAVITGLVFCALGPFRRSLARPARPLKPPPPWLIGVAACIWAVLWYGLVVLAFGLAPRFPPAVAVGAGVVLAATILLLLPGWAAHPDWSELHRFSTIFGTILGSMLVSFVGFIGSWPPDLYFKIAVDLLGLLLLVALGARIRQRDERPDKRAGSLVNN
jgi:hypothetical protein